MLERKGKWGQVEWGEQEGVQVAVLNQVVSGDPSKVKMIEPKLKGDTTWLSFSPGSSNTW